jgi:hypothetical protein
MATSSKELLERIASLRSRLDRLQTHSAPSRPTAAPVPTEVRLTARAAHLLHEARGLLADLKEIADRPEVAEPTGPLHATHREAAGMLDVVLRTLANLPPEAASQLRMCEGLHATLACVDDRIGIVRAGLARRDRDLQRIEQLAQLLRDLDSDRPATIEPFLAIARAVADDAARSQPLRFVACPRADAALFAACHGLAVAQVQAWILRPEMPQRQRLAEAIVPALVHDAGMLHVPSEVLFATGPLDDEARGLIHQHPVHGGQLARKLWPGGGWPVQAAEEHHERIDGSGYPAAKPAEALSEPVRLLAACDVYAALASPRPFRAAVEPRTALADTLQLAEEGRLDRLQAEKLLRLTFYPVGSVVQLSDGSIALVVGTPKMLVHPGRATVLPLRDSEGLPPAHPWPLDLAESPELTIVRSLTPRERSQALGRIHPLLV